MSERNQIEPHVLAGELLDAFPGASLSTLWQIAVGRFGANDPASKWFSRMLAACQADDHDAFLRSFEWRRARMMVLELRGARCACCGRTAADGVKINVDHIKNRKRYPLLALDLTNLQVLCDECNHGKGNKYTTDWRMRDHRI